MSEFNDCPGGPQAPAPYDWRYRLAAAVARAEQAETQLAALEGRVRGLQLWARDQSERDDAFTRRNGGQVVKPNVYDTFAERLEAALARAAAETEGT